MVFLGSTWAISHSSSSTRALQAGARRGRGWEEKGINPGTSTHPSPRPWIPCPPRLYLPHPLFLPFLLLCLYLHSVDPGSSGPRQLPAGPPEAGPANPSPSSLAQWGCSTWVWIGIKHRCEEPAPFSPVPRPHPHPRPILHPKAYKGLSVIWLYFPGNGPDTKGLLCSGARGPGGSGAVGESAELGTWGLAPDTTSTGEALDVGT